jgi:hypothetical protein
MTTARTTLTIVSGTPTAALDEVTFVSLEKLARQAAYDSMDAKSAPRDGIGEDQFDALSCHLLGVGIRAFNSFDGSLTVSEGDAFNHAYRSMRGYRSGRMTEGPYIDWLRTNVRDSRFEPEGSTSVTVTGELPESEMYEESALEVVAEQYAGGLSERDAWTLRHVATALATGLTLREVVQGLLGDLADALAPQLPERAVTLSPDLGSFEELFSDWLREAA